MANAGGGNWWERIRQPMSGHQTSDYSRWSESDVKPPKKTSTGHFRTLGLGSNAVECRDVTEEETNNDKNRVVGE